MANLKLIMNRTSVTDERRLEELINMQESYQGALPKYLEPLRPIIRNVSDERKYGSSFFIYIKDGFNVWEDDGLSTVSGRNQEEIMREFKSVNII